VRASLLLLGGLLLAGCGDGGGGTPAPARLGKARIPAGRVEARIVERPATDRAVVEASWSRGEGESLRLEVVLPSGSHLVEGDARIPLDAASPGGAARWEVGFPTGSPLDLVVRLSARVGETEQVVETAVRLTE
jgi:hypothetical protein